MVGKAVHWVNWTDQLCYKHRIAEIDDNTVFHIMRNNFKVDTAASAPFEDEAVMSAQQLSDEARVVTEAREQDAALRIDGRDVLPNIGGGLAQEIAEMRQQGIEVDDDNEPAPKNAAPLATPIVECGEWVTPTVCPWRADSNCTNNKGIWKRHSWHKIQEMDELSLFQMWVVGRSGRPLKCQI